jgi:ElaB/YqjD/DUF883 family membrane-anchored ribosome-binding protein
VTREDENLSQVDPEVAATEAAWAELRPQRQEQLAKAIKDRIDTTLLDLPSSAAAATKTVRVPLAHYVRLTQFNAAAVGLLVGLFVGLLLAGAGCYLFLDRLVAERMRQIELQYASQLPSARFLREQGEPGLAWDQMYFEPLERGGRDDVRTETKSTR